MLQITCPWCGPRDEPEFHYGGEGKLIPPQASDAEWAGVLYHRPNPVGRSEERWVHWAGCRQWLHVIRDTVTHEIHEVRPVVPDEMRGA
jgi:heterotetrameric sarcosine oxidase delta subunit